MRNVLLPSPYYTVYLMIFTINDAFRKLSGFIESTTMMMVIILTMAINS